MTFASSFSYLNNTIYGININANLDMRLENIPGAAGIAKVYFTDSSVNFQLIFIKLHNKNL